MPHQPTEETWSQKLTLAGVRGAIAGAVRAIVDWLLNHH
jgi:hypothetical protein